MTQDSRRELLPHNHLAEGEATGHFHAAEGADVRLYADPSDNTTLYLVAPHGATVTHQEHRPVVLPPGNYVRRIVREYDHVAEEARAVRD